MTADLCAGTSKKLSQLTRLLGVGDQLRSDPDVCGICADSRRVRPGDVFVAIRGFATDGHAYIGDAIARGASAVVLEDESFRPANANGVAIVSAPSTRRAAAVMADEFHDHPSRDMTLVGITGTNGKTTVALLMDSIFQACGLKTGIIGTLGRSVTGDWRDADRTTPDSIELQALLAEMRDADVTHVAMEVSSHALDLDRVYMCSFAAGIFTNLSQDHLDYHSGLDEYLDAKLKLFTACPSMVPRDKPMIAAVNVDDPVGPQVAEAARCGVITYGTNGNSRVRARAMKVSATGVSFDLVIGNLWRPVRLHLTGHFNVHNALAAAACCYGLDIDVDQIVAGLEGLRAVPGRFERVSGDEPYAVIVDYAHTPGALHNVLVAARALSPTRLICVMGCGGDRDRGKRPMMGKVAAENADVVIVTSDNPRSEDPRAIIEDIEGGMTGADYIVEPDRREAILRAVELCRPGDMLVVAGKGHETYQEFADHRIDFDDRVVAREAIAARRG